MVTSVQSPHSLHNRPGHTCARLSLLRTTTPMPQMQHRRVLRNELLDVNKSNAHDATGELGVSMPTRHTC
eukprot:5013137-Alexandrium_andersonii.AAC.1